MNCMILWWRQWRHVRMMETVMVHMMITVTTRMHLGFATKEERRLNLPHLDHASMSKRVNDKIVQPTCKGN